MELRQLGRTDMRVSAIGFGAWAIGGSWGDVDDEASMRALQAGIDAGMNFIDTADVYGDGRSERLVARLRRERPGETFWVATKAGRRLAAVDELRLSVPPDASLTQLALRWILMFDGVTCTIPAARTAAQARENAAAAALPPLDAGTMAAVRRVYDEHVRGLVHAGW